MNVREVIESPKEQGVDEAIPYDITTTPWGGGPTNVSVVVKQGTKEVTATVMPSGTPSVAGDLIILPKLRNLTAGKYYRVEVKFTAAGADLEAFLIVIATV